METIYILTGTKAGYLEDVLGPVRRRQGVIEAAAVTGPYDMMAKIDTDDLTKAYSLAIEDIGRIQRTRGCGDARVGQGLNHFISYKYRIAVIRNASRPIVRRITMAGESDNTVYIGQKPTMNYVLEVVTQFSTGTGEVIIKARGKSISRAVDVAEIVRNRFIQDAKVKDIRISTEVLKGEEGRVSNVSSIEIFISK